MGRLFGVGVGPGDPELMTVKAQRVLTSSPVVAYFAARRSKGNGFTIVEPFLRDDQELLRLTYPITTEAVDPATYESRLTEFYDESAADISARLDAGQDVAVVCEGDPFFYGSYMYIHQRLSDRYPTEVVPGVTSVSAASAAAGRPLVSKNETLTVLPGVLPPDELKEVLSGVDAAAVMKVGRRLGAVRQAVEDCGLADQAIYVERASCDNEQVLPLADTGDVDAPYFSLVIIPGTGIGER